MRYKRTCLICKTVFEASVHNKIYCGYKCQLEGIRLKRRQYKTLVCPFCGTEFSTFYGNKIYCSRDCAVQAARIFRKQRYISKTELYKENSKYCRCGKELGPRNRTGKCKKCHQKEYYSTDKAKEKFRQHYQNNKEKVLKYHKEYNKKNKERIHDSWKKRYEKNRDCYLQYQSNYRKNNPELLRQRKHDYYENNKEKKKEYDRKYLQEHSKEISQKNKLRYLNRTNEHQQKINELRKYRYHNDSVYRAGYDRYVKENKEKIKEKSKEYRKKNFEKLRQKAHKNWLKKKEKLGLSSIPLISQYICISNVQKALKGEIYLWEHTWQWFKAPSQENYHVDAFFPFVNLTIEYNGRQHYEPVRFGNRPLEEAQRELKNTQKRDQHKAKLLKDHGIKLLIFKYDDPVNDIKFVKKQIKKVLKED